MTRKKIFSLDKTEYLYSLKNSLFEISILQNNKLYKLKEISEEIELEKKPFEIKIRAKENIKIFASLTEHIPLLNHFVRTNQNYGELIKFTFNKKYTDKPNIEKTLIISDNEYIEFNMSDSKNVQKGKYTLELNYLVNNLLFGYLSSFSKDFGKIKIQDLQEKYNRLDLIFFGDFKNKYQYKIINIKFK